MKPPTSEFIRGSRSVIPTLFGVMPFGMVFGFAMKNSDFSGVQSSFFSAVALSGASQLAAVQLYTENTPALIIILTAIIINLRYSMYSLTLQPVFHGKPLIQRLLAGYSVTDQSYAFTMAEYEKNPDNPLLTTFFFGASLTIIILWLLGIFAGYNLGALLPSTDYLDFVIPLIFMFLLIPHLSGGDRRTAVIASAVSSIILVPLLPLHLGLLASIFIGIGSGMVYRNFQMKDKKV